MTSCFDGAPMLRAWWTDPLVATLSFGVAIAFFSLAERAERRCDGDGGSVVAFLFRPPHKLLRAMVAYWIGVTLAHYAYVTAVAHYAYVNAASIPDGCPTTVASALWLAVDVGFGIAAYDAIFFGVHLLFHRPGMPGRRHHATHHADRLSAAKVLDHSLLDGALQVGVNILVQQWSPWGGAKPRIARWLHNVFVTWLLTESHCTAAAPRIARRWFAGVRDHHRHHATGGPPFQQFFGYLDRHLGGPAAVVDGSVGVKNK